jgi:hypothetical protein
MMPRNRMVVTLPEPLLSMGGAWCRSVILYKDDIGVSVRTTNGGPLGASALRNKPAARRTIIAASRRLGFSIVQA